jgi:hypothetical protein
MTNTEINLKKIEEKYDVTIAKGLTIIEENSSVTFVHDNELTRLFFNSNYNIVLDSNNVSVNGVNILTIPNTTIEIENSNLFLIDVSRAIYDETN